MSNRRYTLTDVGAVGLLYHVIAIRVAVYLPRWLSANLVTTLGIVGSIGTGILVSMSHPAAGALILAVSFLDFLDGAVARHRQSSSAFGGVLDGVADVIFLLSVLVGLHVRGDATLSLALALLVLYSFDTALRVLLGHTTALVNRGTPRYLRANAQGAFVTRLRPYIYPLINYFDSVAALALILLIVPQWLNYWMAYELVRRALVTYKKLREIYLIYAESRAT